MGGSRLALYLYTRAHAHALTPHAHTRAQGGRRLRRGTDGGLAGHCACAHRGHCGPHRPLAGVAAHRQGARARAAMLAVGWTCASLLGAPERAGCSAASCTLAGLLLLPANGAAAGGYAANKDAAGTVRLLEGRWRALRAPAKPSHARRLDRVQTRMKKLESLRMDVDAQRRRWAVRVRGQGSTARVCTHLVLCS